MSDQIQVLTKWELESDPATIGENLAKLALDIDASKGNITSIKQRNLWQRLTNNNTRDLAEAMLKQNDTISAFTVIVQGIIFLSMNNLIVLGGIMDALNKAEETTGLRDNKYVAIAKEYLSEAINTAQKGATNEKQIGCISAQLDEVKKEFSNFRKQWKMGLIIALLFGGIGFITSIFLLILALR